MEKAFRGSSSSRRSGPRSGGPRHRAPARLYRCWPETCVAAGVNHPHVILAGAALHPYASPAGPTRAHGPPHWSENDVAAGAGSPRVIPSARARVRARVRVRARARVRVRVRDRARARARMHLTRPACPDALPRPAAGTPRRTRPPTTAARASTGASADVAASRPATPMPPTCRGARARQVS